MSPQVPSDEAVVSGEHAAVEALLDGDAEAAASLVRRILGGAPPAAAFARTVWALRPEIKALVKKLRASLRRLQVSDRWAAENTILAWVHDSVLAAFPPLHDAVIEARLYDLTHRPRDDGGFADARTHEEDGGCEGSGDRRGASGCDDGHPLRPVVGSRPGRTLGEVRG
jgi:hypothetical protein